MHAEMSAIFTPLPILRLACRALATQLPSDGDDTGRLRNSSYTPTGTGIPAARANAEVPCFPHEEDAPPATTVPPVAVTNTAAVGSAMRKELGAETAAPAGTRTMASGAGFRSPSGRECSVTSTGVGPGFATTRPGTLVLHPTVGVTSHLAAGAPTPPVDPRSPPRPTTRPAATAAAPVATRSTELGPSVRTG